MLNVILIIVFIITMIRLFIFGIKNIKDKSGYNKLTGATALFVASVLSIIVFSNMNKDTQESQELNIPEYLVIISQKRLNELESYEYVVEQLIDIGVFTEDDVH